MKFRVLAYQTTIVVMSLFGGIVFAGNVDLSTVPRAIRCS